MHIVIGLIIAAICFYILAVACSAPSAMIADWEEAYDELWDKHKGDIEVFERLYNEWCEERLQKAAEDKRIFRERLAAVLFFTAVIALLALIFI